MRYYLNVPFAQKDEAKALGAKWDGLNKLWYYENEQDEELFTKWLPKQEEDLLEKLSDEQMRLITFALDGKNILVDACIGSGKTTTIQALCNVMPEKRILYLTYNNLLKLDARSKIKNPNVTVTNYHGFAYLLLRRIDVTAGQSDLIQTFLKLQSQIVIPQYDVLILDEYQDIEQEIAEMLSIIKKSNPDIQIIAVGDMAQKIYDKTTLDVPSFIDDFMDEYEQLSFTKCFRLSSDLAGMLGRVWEKEITGVNSNCDVSVMSEKEIVTFLAQQNPQDVLCLGPREGAMARVLNKLEDKYPEKYNKNTVYASIRDEDRNVIRPENNTAIFTTFDSSKGLERKICVVFNFSEEYWQSRGTKPNTKYEILRNIFCVAASRGKEQIIFVQGGKTKNKTQETLLTEKILKTNWRTRGNDHQTLDMSDMFSFKYKEDVEECFSLIKKKKIPCTDNEIIDTTNNDGLIDLSPCIGILQEVSFFKKYNIDTTIEHLKETNKDIVMPKLPKKATLEEKILYATAYDTGYKRYLTQVRAPFVTEQELKQIKKRLSTKFSRLEDVQIPCKIKLSHDCVAKGRIDVLKKDTVYELKFVSELSHEHFLQCASYVVALGLKKGILWNVKTNEQYVITVPDRHKFLQAVKKTVLKIQPQYRKQQLADKRIAIKTSYQEEYERD